MNDAERTVMDEAHASWDRKHELARAASEALLAFAENVYTEYSTFRLCTADAAAREAADQVRSLAKGAAEIAADSIALRSLAHRRGAR